MLAEIANGEKDTADWLFLFGAILFGLAAVFSIPSPSLAKASAWHGSSSPPDSPWSRSGG